MKITCTTLALTLVCLLAATRAAAQSTAPYLIFKTTYAFPGNPHKINEAVVVIDRKDYTKGIYGSYGRGLAVQLGIGKMINATFGFEANAEYLLGRKVSTSTEDAEDSLSGSLSDRVQGFILKPVIVIRNSGDLLSIYTKVGLAISLATERRQEGDITFIVDREGFHTSFASKETSRAKVGFTACFGLAFRVAQSVSVFVEANGQMLSLPITKGHYTKYMENGVDKLPTMSTREKSWVYQRAGFFGEPGDPNQPEPRLYDPANLSYIGIGAGIVYHF